MFRLRPVGRTGRPFTLRAWVPPPPRPASPCRTLSAEQRGAIERRLRVEGHLRPASADELAELRKRKAHPFLLVRVRRSQKMSPSSAE